MSSRTSWNVATASVISDLEVGKVIGARLDQLDGFDLVPLTARPSAVVVITLSEGVLRDLRTIARVAPVPLIVIMPVVRADAVAVHVNFYAPHRGALACPLCVMPRVEPERGVKIHAPATPMHVAALVHHLVLNAHHQDANQVESSNYWVLEPLPYRTSAAKLGPLDGCSCLDPEKEAA